MSDGLGKSLLTLARNAIAEQLGEAPLPETATAELGRPGACFVTLTLGGKLRGCIGSLQAWRPLRDDVRANARASAFRDTRFPPVTKEEFAAVRVEVSLLSEPQAMSFAGEDDALGQLRPGIDGVVLEVTSSGDPASAPITSPGDPASAPTVKQRSTFLPQVWADLPDPRQFLAQLKIKAGLPPDFWSAGVRLSRYQVQKWKEE